MAISNLVLTQQIYSEETNGAHAHYREPVPLKQSEFIIKLKTHSSALARWWVQSNYLGMTCTSVL